jgi:hypothetical protein
MVEESIIEKTIDHYENNEAAYVNDLAEIMQTQPALLAFLSQESIEILLEEEKDILWYIVFIIYRSVENSENGIGAISDDKLSENEERNWSLILEQPRGTFREKISVFFENFQQEDLLAFVEDSLELDDTSPITAVGREVIFISTKSIIDTLLPEK